MIDLWHDALVQMLRSDQFVQTTLILPRDKAPRGGLLMLHLQQQEKMTEQLAGQIAQH
ncbi:MAG: hypothetical protein IAE81_15000 [Caldilineaceae bacterium]|nr:hypothetical protein [Caldilineaceae bacterium]